VDTRVEQEVRWIWHPHYSVPERNCSTRPKNGFRRNLERSSRWKQPGVYLDARQAARIKQRRQVMEMGEIIVYRLVCAPPPTDGCEYIDCGSRIFLFDEDVEIEHGSICKGPIHGTSQGSPFEQSVIETSAVQGSCGSRRELLEIRHVELNDSRQFFEMRFSTRRNAIGCNPAYAMPQQRRRFLSISQPADFYPIEVLSEQLTDCIVVGRPAGRKEKKLCLGSQKREQHMRSCHS
jgi:hypothetical protein